MIGFYDYTVVLTYISLGISVFGMTQIFEGRFLTAVVCLALSGLCDMFDGKIARTKKDRTSDEKLFGVQLDSLCDVVCFGIFPALICYELGFKGPIDYIVIIYYSICSVIRLAFFNVLETNRQQEEDGATKYYHGLPITSIAIACPIVYFIGHFLPFVAFRALFLVNMALVGTLFIIDFKFKKPSTKANYIIAFLTGCVIIAVLFLAKKEMVSFRYHHIFR